MTYVFRFSASDGSTPASRASESGEDYCDSSYSRDGSSETLLQTPSQHDLCEGCADKDAAELTNSWDPSSPLVNKVYILQEAEQAADQQVGAPQKWSQMFEEEKEETETEREFKTDTALQPRAAAPASGAVSPLFPSPCTGFLLSAATFGACAAEDRTGESGDECVEHISVLVGSEDFEVALTMRQQLTEHADSIEKLRKDVESKAAVIVAMATDCLALRELLREEQERPGEVESEQELAREQLLSALLQSERESARQQTATRERRVRALEDEVVRVRQVVGVLAKERADLAAELGAEQRYQQTQQQQLKRAQAHLEELQVEHLKRGQELDAVNAKLKRVMQEYVVEVETRRRRCFSCLLA